VHVVVLVEDDAGPTAFGSAPVSSEEDDGVLPESTRRDVIEGAAPEVIRVRSTTDSTVLPNGTSARSRPSAHVTDEAE